MVFDRRNDIWVCLNLLEKLLDARRDQLDVFFGRLDCIYAVGALLPKQRLKVFVLLRLNSQRSVVEIVHFLEESVEQDKRLLVV